MIQQLKTPNLKNDTKIKSNTQTYFSTFNFPYMFDFNYLIFKEIFYFTTTIFKVTYHRMRWLRVTGLDKI